jgi:hypothetical protein
MTKMFSFKERNRRQGRSLSRLRDAETGFFCQIGFAPRPKPDSPQTLIQGGANKAVMGGNICMLQSMIIHGWLTQKFCPMKPRTVPCVLPRMRVHSLKNMG